MQASSLDYRGSSARRGVGDMPMSGMRFTRGVLFGTAASAGLWALIGYAVSTAL